MPCLPRGDQRAPRIGSVRISRVQGLLKKKQQAFWRLPAVQGERVPRAAASFVSESAAGLLALLRAALEVETGAA